MGDYGVFESIEGSSGEKKIATRETQRKLDAAIRDVKSQYGTFLYASRDGEEWNDRVALCKDDMLRTINAHLMPVTGVVRRIVKACRDDWKTATRRTAEDGPTSDAQHQHLDGPGSVNVMPPGFNMPFNGVGSPDIITGMPNTQPGQGQYGVDAPASVDAAMRGASYRNADKVKELEPQGDWEAYLKSVDSTSDAAVENCFKEGQARNFYAADADGDGIPDGFKKVPGGASGTDLYRKLPGGAQAGNMGIQVGPGGTRRDVEFVGDGSQGQVGNQFEYNGMNSEKDFPDFGSSVKAPDLAGFGRGATDSAASQAKAPKTSPISPNMGGGAGGQKQQTQTVNRAESAGNGGTGGQGGSGGSGGQGGTGGRGSIGAGDYTIQSGDTYSDIAQRAGWGDDYQGMAKATGYQAGNEDNIFAGDTMKVVAPGGNGGSGGSGGNFDFLPTGFGGKQEPTAQNYQDAGVAAPAPTIKAQSSLAVSQYIDWCDSFGARRASVKNLDIYAQNLNDVAYFEIASALTDSGSPIYRSASEWDGTAWDSTGGGSKPATPQALDPVEPAMDALVGASGGAARLPGAMKPLGYGKSGRIAMDGMGGPGKSQGQYGGGQQVNPDELKGGGEEPSTWDTEGLQRDFHVDGFSAPFVVVRRKSDGQKGSLEFGGGARHGTERVYHSFRPHEARRNAALPGERGELGKDWRKYLDTLDMDLTGVSEKTHPEIYKGYEKWKAKKEAQRRTAAPDYLQKADEALTNLLNQKAEEFQETISPLQQALQTVQQAEQAQQMANPMGVQPPAGTVNVLPGQGDPAAGGAAPAGGGDPSAGGIDPAMLQQLIGGGDPSGGGMPPGGGDPSMGGGADPQQMMARRRRQAAEEERRFMDGDYAEKYEDVPNREELMRQYNFSHGPRKNDDNKHVDYHVDEYHGDVGDRVRDPEGRDSSWYMKKLLDENGEYQGKHRAEARRRRARRHIAGCDCRLCEMNEKGITPGPADFENRGRGGWPSPVGGDRSYPGYGGRHQELGEDDWGHNYAEERDPGDYKGKHRAEAANRGKGRGAANRPQNRVQRSSGVVDDFDEYVQGRGVEDAGAAQSFADQQNYSQRGINVLKQHTGQPALQKAMKPKSLTTPNGKPGKPKLTAARRKQAWQGWGPSQSFSRRVAGWEWDDHLNGYLANKPNDFACKCGALHAVPSYSTCKCGKIWNSYVIGTGGDNHTASVEKFICREIPVRDNVIVANRTAKEGGCTCWEGYERVPGTKPCADGSCRKKSNRERKYAKRWTCECGRDDNDDARCNDCGGWGPDGPADNRHEYRESASRRRGEKVTRHDLSDPGPLGKGKDDKMPTIKEDLGDEWYRHGPGGKWVARKKTR